MASQLSAVRSASLALLLLAARATAFGADGTSETQFWPEVDAYVRLTDHTRLFFQYTATREKQLKDYADGQIGGFLDVYMLPLLRNKLREHPDQARSKYLVFRIGYAYSYNPAQGSKKASTDNIPTIEATGRFPLPLGILLTDRNRGDLRIVDGDFEPRYRNRLRLERGFKTGRFLLTPYTDVEVFYDTRYDAWDEVRYTGGLEWRLTNLLSFVGYYTRQRDTKSSPEFVNATGIKAEFYFRNRRK